MDCGSRQCAENSSNGEAGSDKKSSNLWEEAGLGRQCDFVDRGRLTKFKRLPDQIMYGEKCGQKLVKPLRIEKNKNRKTRSQNSTMLED